MKKYLIMMLAIVVASCADPDLKPIVTFDDAAHGAYPRLLSSAGSTLINIQTQADFDASSYTYSIQMIDVANGANVASYTVNVEYVSGGASLGPVELRSFSASDFTMEDGKTVLNNVTITSADVTGAFGLTYASLSPGDNFNITGVIVQQNGLIHTGATSSATINGTAFQGHFDFTLPAACPTDLTGTYDYVTTNAWCDGTGISGTVDIVALGGGRYTFDDFSFGAYSICYSPTSTADQPSLNFTDVCQVVSFTGFSDSYGDTWTFTSGIVGNDWNISWVNTYNESGDAVVTFPGGVPFTLN